MKGLSSGFPDDKTPISGINYLDIHDNFALADQFASKDFDGRLAVDQDLYKIAVTLLYTSLGPIVTHGGSEIMRSKAAAPLKEVVKETRAGYKIYMHGKRDTYNHRAANRFLWETVGSEPSAKNRNDYDDMFRFWQGMNALRSGPHGKAFRVSEPVPEGYYQWILPEEESLLGYLVDQKILVLLNAGPAGYEFTGIELPEGRWKLVANNQAVDPLQGVRDEKSLVHMEGGRPVSIHMKPESLRIWVKDE
jgi:pullulanase/glycogen debranching enzyme